MRSATLCKGSRHRVKRFSSLLSMNGFFSDDALNLYAEAMADRMGFDFSERDTYDFTRCVRPDGTAYGTRGMCKAGSAQAKPAAAPKAPRAPKAAKPAAAPRTRAPKSEMGPAGYKSASDQERANALDAEMRKESRRPQTAADRANEKRSAEAKARQVAEENNARKKRMQGPEAYNKATDKERANALENQSKIETARPQTAADHEKDKIQAAIRARAKAMGF
jgi:hypothetical protein